MNDGMIMNQPTIFGYNAKSNQFLAGGETGSETVVGTQSLMSMIRTAASERDNALAQSIDDWFEKLFALFEEWFPEFRGQLVLDTGTLVAETAPAMDEELGMIRKRRDRG